MDHDACIHDSCIHDACGHDARIHDAWKPARKLQDAQA